MEAINSKKEQKKIIILHCMRCGSEWVQRFERIPQNCSVCNSQYWNQPYLYKHTVRARQRT